MPLFFFTVEQQERAIVERFGKFVRVAGPGLQRKSPFVEKVAGRMSLQVEQLNADIETKTRDNVFVVVKLAIQYMVGADQDKVKDAFYKLDDPEVQMKSYAFDVVRSHIPTMDLDEAYADADTIRSVGEHGNMTTLLLPHSPASVGSLMDQIQQGMLTGNLAANAATGGGNGARRPSPVAPPPASGTPGQRQR